MMDLNKSKDDLRELRQFLYDISLAANVGNVDTIRRLSGGSVQRMQLATYFAYQDMALQALATTGITEDEFVDIYRNAYDDKLLRLRYRSKQGQ